MATMQEKVNEWGVKMRRGSLPCGKGMLSLCSGLALLCCVFAFSQQAHAQTKQAQTQAEPMTEESEESEESEVQSDALEAFESEGADSTGTLPGNSSPTLGAPVAPAVGLPAASAGKEGRASVVPAGALEPFFSLGVRFLGYSSDEETFEVRKVTEERLGLGVAFGYALNEKHTIVGYTDFSYNTYSGSELDDELDYDIGVGTRGELWKAEGVLKPFLGMGVSVRNKTALDKASPNQLTPTQISTFAVSLDVDLGVRFWFAGSNKVFFDFVAGLVRTDLYYEKTTKTIVNRQVGSESVTIALQDVDRGFALIDNTQVDLFSRAVMTVGYSF